jgi:PAS fold
MSHTMDQHSPRMALKLLDSLPTSALHSFCARCGAPPVPRTLGQSAWRESRVCAHCGLGLMLRTPLTVARDSPFLVVDRALNVSAVSRRAEDLVGISEQQAVGQAIGRLLVPAEKPEEFSALLHDAVLGGGASQGVRCWIGEDCGEPLGVRVGPCGPPPGALVVLDPPTS